MAAENPTNVVPVPGSRADEEVVDGLPVLAEVSTLEPAAPAALPAVQAAAAFVAGAATIAIFRRRSARRLARSFGSGRRGPNSSISIVGTRSFLVDVHLIAKPGD